MKLKDVIFAGLAFYGGVKLIKKVIDKHSDQIEAFARKKGAEIGEKIAGDIFRKRSENTEERPECAPYKDLVLLTVLRKISKEDDIYIESLYPRADGYTNVLQGVIEEYGPQLIVDIWRNRKWQR